jgi:2-methylcitrate dehydratase PrpD
MNISDTIAGFAAAIRWKDIPDSVRHEGKRALLNFVASCLAGAHAPAIRLMAEHAAEDGASGPASLFGRNRKTGTQTAAWINAASANVLDFDDTHPATIAHPTAPVAAALFALVQSGTRPAGTMDGRTLLLAAILGIELQCRLGNALSIRHYRRGWHITSTCGGIGAALASGRLLGLPADRLVDAMGGAIAQASGMVETLGTMSKSLGVGGAARAGLASAMLAGRGMTGPRLPLEGRYGFFNVMGDDARPEVAVADLGRHWEIRNLTYKPYPCGVVLNAVIDACMLLRDELPEPAAIASVEVEGHPLLKERTDRPGVLTGNLAQVSAQHAAAVVLLTGRAGPAEFSDESVMDGNIRALAGKVGVAVDAGMAVGAARVTIRTADGRSCARQVDDPRGSVDNPLSDSDLEDKLRARWPDAHSVPAVRIIDLLWRLEEVENPLNLVNAIP